MTTDLWSTWLTAYYGDRANASQHRNIVWSNGALDPWSGMGVYPPSGGPTGPMVQAGRVGRRRVASKEDALQLDPGEVMKRGPSTLHPFSGELFFPLIKNRWIS